MKYVEKKLFPFANGYMNRLTYLYQNGYYWSMSPYVWDFIWGQAANEFYQFASGFASNNGVTIGRGLRPVINLKSDVEISGGVGTSDDPYVVKTA